jgi:hypothetical protein
MKAVWERLISQNKEKGRFGEESREFWNIWNEHLYFFHVTCQSISPTGLDSHQRTSPSKTTFNKIKKKKDQNKGSEREVAREPKKAAIFQKKNAKKKTLEDKAPSHRR